MKKFYVYVVQCRDGTYYTGYTNDLEHRLKFHNSGRGAKYVRGRGPVQLVYQNKYKSLSSALKAEVKIKRLTRKEKTNLIKSAGRIKIFTFRLSAELKVQGDAGHGKRN